KRLPDPSRRMGTGSQALTYCAARMVSGKGQLNSRSTPKWDNFIMLLSADWALEFWPLMGLRLSVEERLKAQSAARNVTKKLLKECKEYWSVNFNDRRIHETRTQFRKALIGSGFSLGQVAEIQSVGDLTSDSDQQNESDKLVWLFDCCTDDLFRIDDSSVTKQ